jgi:type IV pilus assembly protein PilF
MGRFEAKGKNHLKISELRTPNFKKRKYFFPAAGIMIILVLVAGCQPSLQRKKQAEAQMRLGNSMLQEGRPTQALSELIKAEEMDPENPVIRNVLGIAYLEKGMIHQAIDQFEQALVLNPKYAEVHNNLGTAFLREGKVEPAIKEFNKALADPLYPTPHFAQYNLGQAYYALKEYDKSQEYYQEAIKNAPHYSLAYHGLGLTLKANHHLEQAAENLKKAIELAPTYAQAHYDLGEVLLLLHQQSLARLAFKEVIRLTPESSLGQKARKQLKELQ